MAEKKKSVKVFMSQNRIKEIKSEINELERMLKGADKGNLGYLPHVANKIQDPAEVQKEISKKKKMLAEHTPHKLTGQKANKAYAWAKKFEKWFQENQLSNKEFHQMYPKSDSKAMDFERAVQMQVKIMANPRIQRAIQEYKYIMRRLDPDNPMISNVERLRR